MGVPDARIAEHAAGLQTDRRGARPDPVVQREHAVRRRRERTRTDHEHRARHPTGRFVYVGNRVRRAAGRRNEIAVFRIDEATGEPSLIQKSTRAVSRRGPSPSIRRSPARCRQSELRAGPRRRLDGRGPAILPCSASAAMAPSPSCSAMTSRSGASRCGGWASSLATEAPWTSIEGFTAKGTSISVTAAANRLEKSVCDCSLKHLDHRYYGQSRGCYLCPAPTLIWPRFSPPGL